MSKERLSKLQKWILVRGLNNRKEGEGMFGKYEYYHITKKEIYEEFYGLELLPCRVFGHIIKDKKSRGYGCKTRAIRYAYRTTYLKDKDKYVSVSLSRSLKKLKNRGYIRLLPFSVNFGSEISLTEEGVKKAKELKERLNE